MTIFLLLSCVPIIELVLGALLLLLYFYASNFWLGMLLRSCIADSTKVTLVHPKHKNVWHWNSFAHSTRSPMLQMSHWLTSVALSWHVPQGISLTYVASWSNMSGFYKFAVVFKDPWYNNKVSGWTSRFRRTFSKGTTLCYQINYQCSQIENV